MFSRKLCLGQYVAQDITIALVKCVESPPLRLVRRNGIVLHPVSTRVLIEVHAGINALIDGIDVEDGDFARNAVTSARRRRAGLGRTEYRGQEQRKNTGKNKKKKKKKPILPAPVSHITTKNKVPPRGATKPNQKPLNKANIP